MKEFVMKMLEMLLVLEVRNVDEGYVVTVVVMVVVEQSTRCESCKGIQMRRRCA
jgi:hypothetical protein